MSKRRTHKEYLQLMSTIHPNILVLGEYINNATKVKLKCKIDGHEWETTSTHSINRKQGCPRCSGMVVTHEEYVEKVYSIHPNIRVLGKYVNNSTKVRLYCTKDECKHEWEAIPTNTINQQKGCPKCSGRLKHTHNWYTSKMKEIHPNIKILGEYDGIDKKIELQCKIDGHCWESTPNNSINHKKGCPICKTPHLEREVYDLLSQGGYDFVYQDVGFSSLKGVGGKNLSYDFSLKVNGEIILIECQGKQHEQMIDFFGGEKQFKIQQEHDKRKRDFAKENNYKLIEIWYNQSPLEELQRHGLCLELVA